MKEAENETIEVDLLLEAAFQRYGYDFRNYARATIKRRVHALVEETKSQSPSALIPGILHDKSLFMRLVSALSVTVTDLFRDPLFYRELREQVMPTLSTYPYFKIWHAGCATGEEPYSMAILLEEEKLYHRARIYGTDMNNDSLEKAQAGIFDLKTMKQGQANYVKSGGRLPFSDYYHAGYGGAQLGNRFSDNITFSRHNLTSDSSFGEMNMIVCRNVLIYFNRQLKDRVLTLFSDSLCHRGFLCLGTKESLQFTCLKDNFEVVSEAQRIYRKL